MEKKMKKHLTAIYARVSSALQKEEETIESQVSALLDYSLNNNLEVPSEWIFKDEGYSGTLLDRPALDDLRDLVRNFSLGSILIYSPDRLSRKYVNQLILEEEFKKSGVKLIYFNGPKDDSAQDQMMKHFQGIFAEYERAQILDRSRRGKLYKVKEGDKKVFSNAPYGYISDRTDDFYTILPDEAKIVREIYRLYTQEGYNLRMICEHLDALNVKTPGKAALWSATTVRDILRNSAYIGTAYFGKTEKSQGDINRIARYEGIGKVLKPKFAKKNLPKENWYPIPVPQIISENTYEIAQEYLNKNRELSKRNTKSPTILQGILVCGKCGSSYYKRSYNSGKGRGARYYCKSQVRKQDKYCGNISISQSQLDELIWKEVVDLLCNPQLLEYELSRRIDNCPQKKEISEQMKIIDKEIEVLNKKCNRLLDAYQEELLSMKELKERSVKITNRRNELKKERQNLEAYFVNQEKQATLELTLAHFREKVVENSEDLSVLDKQKILRMLIDEIIVLPEEIVINHAIPLSLNKNCQLSSASPLLSLPR